MDRATTDLVTAWAVAVLALAAVAAFVTDLVRRERTGVGVLAWTVVGAVVFVGFLAVVGYRFAALAS